MNPTDVAKDVQEEMKYINDMIMTPPGGSPVMLWEGKSAWQNAYERLSLQGTYLPLGWSDGLALTAQDLCFDLARQRSDGVSLQARAAKYGQATWPITS